MTWSTNDLRPLETRWAITEAQLRRLGGRMPTPMSEPNLVVAREELTRLERESAPPPTDAAFKDATAEFYNTFQRYQRIHHECIDMQRRLRFRQDTPERAILGPLDDALLEPPLSPQGAVDGLFGRQPREFNGASIPGKVYLPSFKSIVSAREATRRMLTAVHGIEDKHAALAKAIEFDGLPSEDKNRRLLVSLFTRIGAMEARLDAIEEASTPKRKQA